MTSITLCILVDVVESMKAIATYIGFTGYRSYLEATNSEGLRQDGAQFIFNN